MGETFSSDPYFKFAVLKLTSWLQGLLLLDLPALVLEEVAKQLTQPELASCMQTCTTLNSMLRPHMTALVSECLS